jgi:hypothetical protein
MGLKRLGGVQTALIGLSELFVTVLSTLLLLGEKLAAAQWPGTALLEGSVLLVASESRLGTLPTPRSWTPLVHGKWAALRAGCSANYACRRRAGLRSSGPRAPSQARFESVTIAAALTPGGQPGQSHLNCGMALTPLGSRRSWARSAGTIWLSQIVSQLRRFTRKRQTTRLP